MKKATVKFLGIVYNKENHIFSLGVGSSQEGEGKEEKKNVR